MPVPIRMISNPPDASLHNTESRDIFMMNLDALAGATAFSAMQRASSIKVNAEATDKDAEILLDLFNRSTIISEAESAEDKKYAVPKDFSGDHLLRLKAASLVNGDTKIVKFTSKAVRVIKTLVLSEPNSYTKTAIKKPYSIILAENKAKSANHNVLAFQKTASTISAFAQRNIPIEDEYMPQIRSPYLKSQRLTFNDGSSNKQYIVRMFFINNRWSVIAWNGRNVRGRALTMQPKGSFGRRSLAEAVFDDLIGSKRREGYETARDIQANGLLGVDMSIEDAPDPLVTDVPRRRQTRVVDPTAHNPTELPSASETEMNQVNEQNINTVTLGEPSDKSDKNSETDQFIETILDGLKSNEEWEFSDSNADDEW